MNPATPPHHQPQRPINKHPAAIGQETHPLPFSLFPGPCPLIPCSTKTYPPVADHFPAQAHNRIMFAILSAPVPHNSRRSPQKQPLPPPLPPFSSNQLNQRALYPKAPVFDPQTKDLRRAEVGGIRCAVHQPLLQNR